MEKKGELLNQLAIIVDLIEKLNTHTQSNTLVFELSKMEFDRVFDYLEKKYDRKTPKPKNSFNITIGKVDVIFNTNNA
jgi:hypothetical protein